MPMAAPPPFPMTSIGGAEMTRLIIGTNMFCAASHLSKGRDDWLRRHFTHDRIYEVIAACAEGGLNAILAGPWPELKAILVDSYYGRPFVELSEREAAPAPVAVPARKGAKKAAE